VSFPRDDVGGPLDDGGRAVDAVDPQKPPSPSNVSPPQVATPVAGRGFVWKSRKSDHMPKEEVSIETRMKLLALPLLQPQDPHDRLVAGPVAGEDADVLMAMDADFCGYCEVCDVAVGSNMQSWLQHCVGRRHCAHRNSPVQCDVFATATTPPVEMPHDTPTALEDLIQFGPAITPPVRKQLLAMFNSYADVVRMDLPPVMVGAKGDHQGR
jgi:hypothetical protein